MNERELDMNELIRDFNEYSTDYNKTTCEYYEEYLRNYQKEKLQLQNNWNELKEYCKNNYYGTTTIGILDKMQELEKGKNE